jgi:hypothetical protein
MAKDSQTKIIDRAKSYLKVNWGAPFLVGFIVLLLGAPVLLLISAPVSDTCAVLAFCTLIIGVMLQLASFLKYDKKACPVETIS